MWPRGRRRNKTDAQRFIAALVREFGNRRIAEAAGVHMRTVQKWTAGTDWPTRDKLLAIVDGMFPAAGSLPLYSPDMALDGGTRLGGVGEYSIRAAQGDTDYIGESLWQVSEQLS